MSIRVLHVVKTSQGARWAALQANILSKLGHEIHVVLPSNKGEAVSYWTTAQAKIHFADFSLPVTAPQTLYTRIRQIRELVGRIQPHIIHSHFVTTTIMLRLALGRYHETPRIFQVPGPLHLEHAVYRIGEISSAGAQDYWIASSRYTMQLYANHGIASEKLFLSYYGFDLQDLVGDNQESLHTQYRLPPQMRLVGNINYMYPPKQYLGQKYGLKRHEDVIDALALVVKKREDVMGVLVGGQWGKGTRYEERLVKRAQAKAGKRILFTGRVSPREALRMWHGFDCAVHVPESENCGGVIEPLAAQVPTIASQVGGLPEVVLEGITGWIVPVGKPRQLADQIMTVLANREEAQKRARQGQKLVNHMFDVKRTGQEIAGIYEYILGISSQQPIPFDSRSHIGDVDI